MHKIITEESQNNSGRLQLVIINNNHHNCYPQYFHHHEAAVAYGPGKPFVVERVLVHPPQKMEVRIKILFTSISHTDLSSWQGENEAHRAYPRIFGHEASGIVESVGEGVSEMKEGDLVVPIFNGGCRDCKYCMCEKTNMSQRFGVNPMKKVMASDGTTKVFYNGWKTHLPFLEHFNFRRVHSGGFSMCRQDSH
ncbi:Alcohol dehydrogenase-like 4 isoform B [Glycine soja]|uniref:Alcohol dehydrogenase-like 4 isoform A n=1 Tax=Glycine soja TaxID=3848 RepID=A0A445M1W7_GLYSO|nr:Alcohol dehydrogenase-like 4 isoform A [Glycine soja]RZC29536.1 Alcohol dehydrogenase-like 4 isoform B [Glycine soja]